MTNNNERGLGFDGWMKRLDQEFGRDTEQFDPRKPMDDLTKLRWLNAIDHRYMMALPRVRVGSADQALINELRGIAGDYGRVLGTDAPKLPVYDKRDVGLKVAAVTALIAAAFEYLAQPDYAQARQNYETAAKIYDMFDDRNQVQRMQQQIERLQFAQDNNIDKELLRLQRKLQNSAADSLDYVDVVIEIATIYRN
ncbi:MAG: hypothetical protein R3293_25020, partial [Candidatus Promineifilaceae bacterium]|nr:hypothetical protein [Candidatus Promineifilaceae bacterium]